MLGEPERIIWFIGFLLEAGVVVSALFRKRFLRYTAPCVYMLCAAIVDIATYACYQRLGLFSKQYFYFYYYTDALMMILMFFVIIQFYQRVLVQMNVGRYVRGGAAMLLAATALFSYLVVHQNKDHMTVRFVVEMEQNLNFVGVVLIYLLWGAILKLRETRTQLVQLVLALGIYFSATAGTYALRNLFPGFWADGLHYLPAIIGTWLPAAWLYTFMKVPEDARLATARLAAAHATAQSP